MDRPVDQRYQTRKRLRGALTLVAVLASAAVAFTLITGWLSPSLQRSKIRTAVVDRGPIEATLTATGLVVPEYEHVLTSPIDSRVSRILLTPGATVHEGEPILTLDAGETTSNLEKLDDQIGLKRNEREQARLTNEREHSRLRTRRDVKALELASREFEADRARRNLADGIFSEDEVRQAENDAARAGIELREIGEAVTNLATTLEATSAGLDLEIAILERDRLEAVRRLERATATSDREGVLTWVVTREGSTVRRGEELARIADLSAFRVEATVSDVHADRVSAGQPVFVRTGDHRLAGRVDRVRPTVENGAVTLVVALDEKSHPVLRHNLRVDVYIITDRVEDALRIRRGTYLMTDGTHGAFVIRGDAAIRTPVEFGITNIDYYQILHGLEEGEEIIVSDMSDRMHLREVQLK